MSSPDPKVAPDLDARAEVGHHFAVVPAEVLKDPAISDAAARLYGVLDSRITGTGSQRIRQDTLAADLGWSPSKVKRAMSELVKAGYVLQTRTSRSSRLSVVNPVRYRRRSVKSERADRSDMTPPQINKSSINNNNNSEQGQDRSSAPKVTPAAGRFLDEINKATGVRLAPTRALLEKLETVSNKGLSPADVAALSAAHVSAHGDRIRNMEGFVAGFVLDALVAGNPPVSSMPKAAPVPVPSGPQTYMQQVVDEPCSHGEPRGSSYCAICRHESSHLQAAGTAV
jgi:hypothetical protein